MTRGWKVAIGMIAAIVLLDVSFSVLRSVTGGSPGGPELSSYATGPSGVGAWAQLLSHSGHAVRRVRFRPSRTVLPPGSTVVLLDPRFVLSEDASALRQFVASGGRLVAGGGDTSWFREVVPGGLQQTGQSLSAARPLAPVSEVAGVRLVTTGNEGSWRNTRSALPILGANRAAVAAVKTVGAGRAVLLADPTPLENALLGRTDNARFALDIAGPPARPVLFLETYHGYGSQGAAGLGAIPFRWQWLFAFEALAVLVFMLAKGRRLGPPQLAARELPPPRSEYVAALAGTLARTRKPALALAPLVAEIRRSLAKRARLGPDATPAQLADAGKRLGLSAEETEAVTGTPAGREDVLAVGRALARLRDQRGRDEWQG